MIQFVIYDELHCELISRHESLEAATAELARLAALPWSEDPNRAPCVEWRDCGRHYEIRECDTASTPWSQLRVIKGLKVEATGTLWYDDLEQP
ncbi:MAG: hypothetical protein AB7O52_01600 [Planctomycetota bacterium]